MDMTKDIMIGVDSNTVSDVNLAQFKTVSP